MVEHANRFAYLMGECVGAPAVISAPHDHSSMPQPNKLPIFKVRWLACVLWQAHGAPEIQTRFALLLSLLHLVLGLAAHDSLCVHFHQTPGCSELPQIEAKTIGKMGLKGVPGLNVAKGGG